MTQSLAAGSRQLATPMVFDQSANASSLGDLRGGGSLPLPRDRTAPSATVLDRLLGWTAAAETCRTLATSLLADPLAPAIELTKEVGGP